MMKARAPNKAKGISSANLRSLAVKALQAKRKAADARKQARLAKARFKQARKAMKQARKAAKAARKAAKAAAKALATSAAKAALALPQAAARPAKKPKAKRRRMRLTVPRQNPNVSPLVGEPAATAAPSSDSVRPENPPV